MFDDASLKGARGVLISITGGEDLTLYEVDEAASRIRQEVDEEANIIVGAIIEPALEQAMRVSVVATDIDQSANCRMAQMSAQPLAEPVLHPNVKPPSLHQTAETPFSTVELRIERSPQARSSKFRLFHRLSSHFQSRRGGESGQGDAHQSASNSTVA